MLTDDEIMAQVLEAFHQEQAEHRQAMVDVLLELEHARDNSGERQALLDQLFREAHSLKGGARAAGILAVEELAHRVEDLFSVLRQGELVLTPEICDPIYAALDAIGALMQQVSAGHPASLEPYRPQLEALTRLVRETRGLPTPLGTQPPMPRLQAEVPVEPPAPPVAAAPAAHEPAALPASTHHWDPAEGSVRLTTATLDRLMNETGELMTCTVRAQQRSAEARNLADLPARWRRTWRQTRPALSRLTASVSETPASAAAQLAGITHAEVAPLLHALDEANSLIAALDQRLALYTQRAAEDHMRLTAVTDRLHDQVRRTRMLSAATLFNPLRLQTRDMARAAGKRVQLNIDDGGAEADRQVLDGLRDVLMHLLRNAIDHGIESPEQRVAAGKAPEGRLALRAAVNGDRLLVSLADDGAGLDLSAIQRRALSSGLVAEADLERMSEGELYELIFVPGFSTRESVGALSGRGVGLDVVRSNVERMHGRVGVESLAGAGCTFTLSVPLSLTSSHGLLLSVAGASYLLPIDAVQRIVPAPAEAICIIEGRPTLTLDGRPLLLCTLADLLGQEAQPRAAAASGRLALLLGNGERLVACLVDEVLGEQELVAQRLPAPLRRVRGVAGATILADGSVVPILDAVDLLRAARGTRHSLAVTPEAEARRPQTTVLVVDDSITTRTLEKNILEAAGYRVVLATDGTEAMAVLNQLAEHGGCNLLVSDVDMPRLNGFDLTAQVRASARYKHLPVVLVTSLDSPADRERGIAAGADAYIVKRHFDQQTLLDTISQLL
jgi:two-component system, chemotaxis family, sensor kinase CheA